MYIRRCISVVIVTSFLAPPALVVLVAPNAQSFQVFRVDLSPSPSLFLYPYLSLSLDVSWLVYPTPARLRNASARYSARVRLRRVPRDVYQQFSVKQYRP